MRFVGPVALDSRGQLKKYVRMAVRCHIRFPMGYKRFVRILLERL